MKISLFYGTILIIVVFTIISGCGGNNSAITYITGQSNTYIIDGISFNMHYVQGGLTFSTDNDAIIILPASVANAYWIGETDVTYQLWSAVYAWAIINAPYKYHFANAGVAGSENVSILEPVTTINWRDAMIWCNALTEYYYGNSSNCVYYTDATFTTPIRSVDNNTTVSTANGSEDNPYINPSAKGFRLPSSNEWELAARYIDGSNWTPGNFASGATADYTNESTTSAVAVYGTIRTAVVKSKNPNYLNLYDMSGNVWKWCLDWNPEHSGWRMTRGGSWITVASTVQIGFVGSPSYPHLANANVGFRFVKTQ